MPKNRISSISEYEMHEALCNSVSALGDTTVLRDYTASQTVEFILPWRSTEFVNKDIGDIFSTAQRVLGELPNNIRVLGKLGHGIKVLVSYDYPLSFWVRGNTRNRRFVLRLAMNDLARALHRFHENRASEICLDKFPDPSPWWSKYFRTFELWKFLRSKRLQQASTARERARRQRDFQ